jgi:hypothetical protein
MAIATDGTRLSPRLEHLVIHHQPSSRFSGGKAVTAMPDDGLGALWPPSCRLGGAGSVTCLRRAATQPRER